MLKPSAFAEWSKLCLRSFPERLEQRISGAEPLPDARHPALSFTLSWREGRRPRVERLIVRRYADPWTWWSLEDREKARREWTVMRWAYGHGLPVPAPYAWEGDEGKGFVLMARASGRNGTSLDGERVQLVRPYLDALAACLAHLHRLAPSGAVCDVLPNAVVQDELARLGEVARQVDGDELAEAVAGLATASATLNVEEGPPCVLHGDPHFANALLDARGITALQNWENGALGDPRWDVARAVDWLRGQWGEDLADRFCSAYAERAGQPLSDMPFWTALAAVQSWALAAWVRTGVQEGSLAESPAASALIAQWGTWRERAWRAWTRLRSKMEERSVS
jgi:aminoglycoside phosphotransferase (APT) family kinase protein